MKASSAVNIALIKNNEILLEVKDNLMNRVSAFAHLKILLDINAVPTEIQLQKIDQWITIV